VKKTTFVCSQVSPCRQRVQRRGRSMTYRKTEQLPLALSSFFSSAGEMLLRKN
jgi:hypothetical protein